jgi:hypothetical protein
MRRSLCRAFVFLGEDFLRQHSHRFGQRSDELPFAALERALSIKIAAPERALLGWKEHCNIKFAALE